MPLLCLLLVLAPARAGEVTFSIEPRGLHAVGVSFFGAMAQPAQEDGKVEVRFGELDRILWDRSTLPTLDVRAVVANTAYLHLPRVAVQVSIYLGKSPTAALPPPESIEPGGAGIRETLFFERIYDVENLAGGGLGEILVARVQLDPIIADAMRQKEWPVYVRAEIAVSEPSGEVKVVQPTATSFLRLFPRAPIQP